MSVHSKKRAKTIRIQNGPALAFAALLVALLALWPHSPASASALAPFAGEMTRSAPKAGAVAAEARTLAGFRIHRTLRPFRAPSQVSARPAHRPYTAYRIVLTPRKLAANAAPGVLEAGLTENVQVAPALAVKASWAEAAEPTAQNNPFTLVGNRSGLENATQTEVRGGEVWLTGEPRNHSPADAGGTQGGAP